VVFEPVQSHTCLLLIEPVDDSASDDIVWPFASGPSRFTTAAGRPMKPVRRKSRLTFLLLICGIRTQFIAERPQKIPRIPLQVKNLRLVTKKPLRAPRCHIMAMVMITAMLIILAVVY
jgi:hypothetical protein